eukprot:TRINITY_DN6640_c1_g1_i1.p1 TRINITY_DN6640_c1_g1~~TRINITY_DN6640_c1_g1_i1.p1  ORF type:complete len:458 (+),score=146.32 TRINITY_DN6640_c1_g1_i1:65-1375(+)
MAPVGEPLWRRAAAGALAGQPWVGDWEVPGKPVSGHPKQKKWDKPVASEFEVAWWQDRTILLPDDGKRAGQKLSIAGLERCRVVALGSCDCIDVDDCTDCEIVLGCCSGSLFVRNCTGLCLTACCRQLRMFEVNQAELFVHVETDPCVEASAQIVLRPLNASMPGLVRAFAAAGLHAEDNRFRHAADFSRFADTKRELGFSIPQWVGVVSMRRIAPPGCPEPDAPEAVAGILRGELAGGQSLERGAGTFAMGPQGVSAEAAQQQAQQRQGAPSPPAAPVPAAAAPPAAGAAAPAAGGAPGGPAALSPEAEQAHQQLQGMLRRLMRLAVLDGRVFIGRAVCIDGAGNVILAEAHEYREKQVATAGRPPLRERRSVGAVIIPGAQITSVRLGPEEPPQPLGAAQFPPPQPAPSPGPPQRHVDAGAEALADELVASLGS